eukprot:gene4974-5622_t
MGEDLEKVREKLVSVFQGREEVLCRVLFFLDQEDLAYKDNLDRPYSPYWRSLKSTVNHDNAFRMYAEQLAENTKIAENNMAFKLTMQKVYEELLNYSEEPCPADQYQGFDVVRLHNSELCNTSAFSGLARAWSIIPAESQEAVRSIIRYVVTNRNMLSGVDEIVGLVNRSGGTVVMVTLASVYLTWEAYKNIRRWWNGEISGKRCAKCIIDSIAAVGAGVAGGVAGVALGTFLTGPIGAVAMGVLGGIVGSAGGNYLVDFLTQKIFDLPKSEVVEKAYNYLGVKPSAPNCEVNAAFHKLCRLHHPDKGGRKEEFIILQCHMSAIRQQRGEI